MCVTHFAYSFSCGQMDTIVSNVAVNTVYTCLLKTLLPFLFGYIPRSGIVGSYCKSIFFLN